MAKQLIFDEVAREKMVRGVQILSRAVAVTLGPRGNNVALQRVWGVPVVVHDGVTVAKDIILEDTFENMGAQLVKEAATKTNDSTGDGTTTATILASELVTKGMKLIASGANAMLLKKGMDIASEKMLTSLDKIAHPVKEADWVKVATISAQNELIGKKIAEAFRLVGSSGEVEVEEGKGLDIEIEHTDGLSFDKGYLAPHFVTQEKGMEVILNNPYILITDISLSANADIIPFMETYAKAAGTGDRSLLVIAEDVGGEALPTMIINKVRGTIKICPVKAPDFGDRRKEVLEDIAILTGGTVITKDAGLDIKKVKIENFGQAQMVRITKDMTVITGGKGDKKLIKARIAQIESQVPTAFSEFDKEKLAERVAKLSGGVAVIKVGASTETEMFELKERVIDAKGATQAAIEEGIVPGGGVAYLHASKDLEGFNDEDADVVAGVNLVKKAIESPLRLLAEYGGEDGGLVLGKIKENKNHSFGFNVLTQQFGDLVQMGVIDPVKVTKHALKNAVSVAGMILTTRCMVADIPEKVENKEHQQ